MILRIQSIDFLEVMEIGLFRMAHRGGWKEVKWSKKKKKGGLYHSVNAVTSYGSIYCIEEKEEEITTYDFQEFINGPTGPSFV